jgi:hypothetical protein
MRSAGTVDSILDKLAVKCVKYDNLLVN